MGFELDFFKVNKAEKQQFISQQYGDLKDLLEDESLTEVVDYYCSDGTLFSDIIYQVMGKQEGEYIRVEREDLDKISSALLTYISKMNICPVTPVNSFVCNEEEDITLRSCDGIEVTNPEGYLMRIYNVDTSEIRCYSNLMYTDSNDFFNVFDYIKTIEKIKERVNFSKEELYFVGSF